MIMSILAVLRQFEDVLSTIGQTSLPTTKVVPVEGWAV